MTNPSPHGQNSHCQPEVAAHDHVGCMQHRAGKEANSHDHGRQEEGGPFSSSCTKSEKRDDDSHLLIVLPMKLICRERRLSRRRSSVIPELTSVMTYSPGSSFRAFSVLVVDCDGDARS